MNKKFLFVLLSFALLTMLLGACKIIDASTLPKAAEVQMGSSQFIQQEVTIHKGESIDLVNQPTSNHVIANGQNIAASASLVIGPFNVAGDYHYYCNIHPGMNLTIHVT